jgi:hypothetical protein
MNLKYLMKVFEVITKPLKPLTPQQLRIKSLKQNVERDRQQLNAEREKQRKDRDAQRLDQLNLPLSLLK